MPISFDLLDQIRHIVRPIATRVANTVARGPVTLVNDSKKMQIVQVLVAGDPVDDGEHYQAYGFSSVPLEGAEHVTLFPDGDREHPLVVVVADRRHRPTGGKPGDVTMYHHKGARVRMLESGDIELQPAPGREVFIRDEGGQADRLVKKSEFDGHKHGPGDAATGFKAPAGTAGGPITGTSGGAAAVQGTQRLRVQ